MFAMNTRIDTAYGGVYIIWTRMEHGTNNNKYKHQDKYAFYLCFCKEQCKAE